MDLVLFILPVIAVAAYLVYHYHGKGSSPQAVEPVDYAGVNNPHARRRFIRETEDVAALEEAAEVWVGQGLSRDGLFYAEILERKEQLTGSLSDVEAMRVRRAHAARIEGAKLPPIKGVGGCNTWRPFPAHCAIRSSTGS